MAGKIKIQNITSREFTLIVCQHHQANDGRGYWYVRNRESGSDTAVSYSFEDYRALKRVWRKSKEDFESACRFMNFNTLFSQLLTESV